MGYVRRYDTERTQGTSQAGTLVIIDDEMPDPENLSLGEPMNESYGAICAMLTEHMVDAERLNRWLMGLMLVALDHCDASTLDIADALETIPAMTHADMAIAGFDSMNTLVGLVKEQKKAKRGRRSQG